MRKIKISAPQIAKGFIIFVLSFSGLGIAILLRIFEYNGYVITTFGVLVEGLSMVLCYLLFRNYLKTESEEQPSKIKKIKK